MILVLRARVRTLPEAARSLKKNVDNSRSFQNFAGFSSCVADGTWVEVSFGKI